MKEQLELETTDHLKGLRNIINIKLMQGLSKDKQSKLKAKRMLLDIDEILTKRA